MLALSSWTAPPALLYGTVAMAVVSLGYLVVARPALGRKESHDVAVALAITVAAAVTGFVLLAAISLDVILGYTYGGIVGAALVRLVGKYRRLGKPA